MNEETRETVLAIYMMIRERKEKNALSWKLAGYGSLAVSNGYFGAIEEDLRILSLLKEEYPDAFRPIEDAIRSEGVE